MLEILKKLVFLEKQFWDPASSPACKIQFCQIKSQIDEFRSKSKHLAMSILFPLVILSKESTTERFYRLATWDPSSNTGDPVAASGFPGTTKEAARVWAQGAGQGQGPGPRPWAASFVVPGTPEAATGCPVFEDGSQVANL